jgi:prevent-host-death family protein
MSATIDAAEAGMHFARLLERAERGEEITITRRGRPVARLGPAGAGHDVAAARAAADRLRALGREMNLDSFTWDEWRAYRDEGRR